MLSILILLLSLKILNSIQFCPSENKLSWHNPLNKFKT